MQDVNNFNKIRVVIKKMHIIFLFTTVLNKLFHIDVYIESTKTK